MKSVMLFLCLLSCCLFLSGRVFADTTDLWESFPDNQGQNHFFALALPWNNTGEGSYRQMDDFGAYMWGTSNSTVPYIYRDADPWVEMYPSSDGGVNGTGLKYENAIYTYKVPAAGVVDITGAFKKGEIGDAYVFVKHNTNFLWNHTFSSLDAAEVEVNFNVLNESINVGDELYFGVGCGVSGKNIGDLTFLRGQINAVPEPVSCALFLLGAGALAGARRRRRKA
jgi:hypothetical protein